MTDATALLVWFAGGLLTAFGLRFFSVLPSALRKDRPS